MVGNGFKSSEKLRETLADIEGPVLSQSPALRKLSILVQYKGERADKSHLTRAQQKRQNEHTSVRIAGMRKVGLIS